MANEIEIVVSATNDSSKGLTEAEAAARRNGEMAGAAYEEAFNSASSGATGGSEEIKVGLAGAGAVEAEVESLGATVAKEAEQVGEKTGASLADGMSKGVAPLAERMRVGLDTVLAEWEQGTTAFNEAQLQTFADQYAKLAAAGDEAAAQSLARVQALAAGMQQATTSAMQASNQATLEVQAEGFSSFEQQMQAQLEAYKASLVAGGTESGLAFVRSFDEAVSGASLSSEGISGAFVTLTAEAATDGAESGDAFGISFSASAKASIMQSSISAGIAEAFAAVPQPSPTNDLNLGASSMAVREFEQQASGFSNAAAPIGTSLKDLSGTAEKATGSMGGLAAMMYGPLGYAAFGLMSFLPMMSGMFTTSAISASAFTTAVQQDSFAVGNNTAATIQQTLAKSGLNDMSKSLGVSQATLIEYAAGEKQAQETVTAAYSAKENSLNTASNAEGIHSKAQADAGNSADQESNALANKKAALDQVTSAVQQAIAQDQAQSDALLAAEHTTQIYNAAVNALGSQMLLQTEQTQMSNQATTEYSDRVLAAMQTTQYFNAAVGAAGAKMLQGVETTKENNTAIVQYGEAVMGAYRDTATFNAALDASYVSMQISAQTSAQTSVGLLNMGDAQTSLNDQLVMAEDAYTQSASGATAYGTALTALNGDTSTLLGTEAAFTTSLDGLTKSIKTNGDSLDINTTKGAANTTAIIAIANAADKAAAAVYQNEVNTVGSTKAYEDANTKLAQEKKAFEDSAISAGMNKDEVKKLADQLFQLPPSVNIPITANVAPALNGLAEVINRINSSSGTVTIYENSSGTVFSSGGGNKAQATGGIIGAAAVGGAQSGFTWVGEHGPELAQLPIGTTVYPNSNAQSMVASGGPGGGDPSEMRVILDVEGSGELIPLLRKAIKARAGTGPNSVQRALGYSY